MSFIPISENRAKGTFLVFDTAMHVAVFIKKMREKYGAEFEKFLKLKHEAKKVIVTEVGIFPASKE